MPKKSSYDTRHLMGGFGVLLLLAISWLWGLRFTPTEEHMGDVYRIIYLHVPVAFTAFFSAFVLLVVSIWALAKKESEAALVAKAAAETGLLFTVLTLATGSIWGRPTWGVWWDWDARLTTTLILAILYCGYLILYSSLHQGPQRNKVCAALGIVIAADVPIIYKSVTWWRTLHQPPTLMRQGESTMAPEMLSALLFSLFVMLLVGGYLVYQRYLNLSLQEELERLSYQQAP